jgi:anti-anti-sigma regulatory factor
MPLPGCRLSFHVEPPTAYIRIVGRAAVEGARDFGGLVERLQGGGVSQICIDLSACLLMDSTFSGVLAGLATRTGALTSEGSSRFVLVQPNDRIRDMLDSLGVLPLVDVLDSSAPAALVEAKELTAIPRTKWELAECCLEAHRLLMALRPENEAKFRELTRALEHQFQTPPAP